MEIRPFLALSVVAILSLSNTTFAQSSADTETRRIVDRCQKAMGKHGAAMVEACVNRDIAAIDAILAYPKKKHIKTIVSRCARTMGQHGWAMVRACADRDIEARQALLRYPESAAPTMRRCGKQMREHGWAMTKACTDRDLKAAEKLRALRR